MKRNGLTRSVRRLSIDIDVLCPPGTDIEQYLQNCDKYGFTDCKVIHRENRNGNIPKGHYKSFFEVVYSDQIEDSVLLDVLYEDNHYHKIEKYSGNVNDVKDITISPIVSKEVAKIRRGNPEAYYYWCKISQLLTTGNDSVRLL